MIYLPTSKLIQREKNKRKLLESVVERQAADIDYLAMMGDIDLEQPDDNEIPTHLVVSPTGEGSV